MATEDDSPIRIVPRLRLRVNGGGRIARPAEPDAKTLTPRLRFGIRPAPVAIAQPATLSPADYATDDYE